MSLHSRVSKMESNRSFTSLESSMSGKSFLTGKGGKFELKRRFYENISDFKSKVVLHKEPGFVVYRARCSFSGGVVVLKGYSRETLTLQTRQRICVEVGTLQSSQCPFILKCFDSFEDHGWWWLVLENCAAGDLYHIVQNNGPIWEEGWLVSQVLLPLLQTLTYLHAEGIIHRDVKPEHVLFNSEKVAKLSGFYLAQDVNKFGMPKDMVGTLDYVAPEVFKVTSPEAQKHIKAGRQSATYDFKVDVWQLGILTYDVLVGRPPFNQELPNQTVEHILLQDPEFPDEVSDMAADFVLNCLTKDPEERPTAAQLLAHPWVREYLAWTPPDDFDDIVPDFDTEYYHAALREDNQDASDSEDEDEVRVKWYNPKTWTIFRPRGVEDFQGEFNRGGINKSVMSFAKKLLGKPEDKDEDEDAEADYLEKDLEKKGLDSLKSVDSEKPAKVGSMLKNKVAPEKFVKDMPLDEDEEEAEEARTGGAKGADLGKLGGLIKPAWMNGPPPTGGLNCVREDEGEGESVHGGSHSTHSSQPHGASGDSYSSAKQSMSATSKASSVHGHILTKDSGLGMPAIGAEKSRGEHDSVHGNADAAAAGSGVGAGRVASTEGPGGGQQSADTGTGAVKNPGGAGATEEGGAQSGFASTGAGEKPGGAGTTFGAVTLEQQHGDGGLPADAFGAFIERVAGASAHAHGASQRALGPDSVGLGALPSGAGAGALPPPAPSTAAVDAPGTAAGAVPSRAAPSAAAGASPAPSTAAVAAPGAAAAAGATTTPSAAATAAAAGAPAAGYGVGTPSNSQQHLQQQPLQQHLQQQPLQPQLQRPAAGPFGQTHKSSLGLLSHTPKASPRTQLPPFGVSPRGRVPPIHQANAHMPPPLPPGISPRLSTIPIGSPRLPPSSTTTPQQQQQQQSHRALHQGPKEEEIAAIPTLETTSVGDTEGGEEDVALAQASQSPSQHPRVPALRLGGLLSPQKEGAQQPTNTQAHTLPWGHTPHTQTPLGTGSQRPQSRMAEDLVLESARGARADSLDANGAALLAGMMPQPHRVTVSRQGGREGGEQNVGAQNVGPQSVVEGSQGGVPQQSQQQQQQQQPRQVEMERVSSDALLRWGGTSGLPPASVDPAAAAQGAAASSSGSNMPRTASQRRIGELLSSSPMPAATIMRPASRAEHTLGRLTAGQVPSPTSPPRYNQRPPPTAPPGPRTHFGAAGGAALQQHQEHVSPQGGFGRSAGQLPDFDSWGFHAGRPAWANGSNDTTQPAAPTHAHIPGSRPQDISDARLNEVHAFMGPSAPNTARDEGDSSSGAGGGASQSKGWV